MKEDKYQEKLSGMKHSRVGALICLVIIAVIVIATLVTGIMGSRYFYGCLFMCIVVPVMMYVALWIGKVLHSIYEDKTSENMQNKDKEKD